MALPAVPFYGLGLQAPAFAAYPEWAQLGRLWLASWVHIDAAHLLINIGGLILMMVVFARWIKPAAVLFAFFLAAPAAHAVVIWGGQYQWIAGLSTATHAILAFGLMQHWAGGRQLANKTWSPSFSGEQLTAIFALGLALKLVLDALFPSVWSPVSAQTAASSHAVAAGLAGLAGLWTGSRAEVSARTARHVFLTGRAKNNIACNDEPFLVTGPR